MQLVQIAFLMRCGWLTGGGTLRCQMHSFVNQNCRTLINILGKLPEGTAIALVILTSDKTMLSQFHGDKQAWPVYLTRGNIEKEMQCKLSAHATVFIGYIPVTKLDCFTKATQPLAAYCLFHLCISKILNPLSMPEKMVLKLYVWMGSFVGCI